SACCARKSRYGPAPPGPRSPAFSSRRRSWPRSPGICLPEEWEEARDRRLPSAATPGSISASLSSIGASAGRPAFLPEGRVDETALVIRLQRRRSGIGEGATPADLENY